MDTRSFPCLRTEFVVSICSKSLAKDPHDRFATVQAFAMALRQATQSSGVPAISDPTAMPSVTLPPQFIPGGQTPAATVTPNVMTPPANRGIPPTQLPGAGMAKAGAFQTDIPPLPPYQGQKVPPTQAAKPPSSVPIKQPGAGIAGAGEARTELPPLPAYPGQPSAPQNPQAPKPIFPPDHHTQRKTNPWLIWLVGTLIITVLGGIAVVAIPSIIVYGPHNSNRSNIDATVLPAPTPIISNCQVGRNYNPTSGKLTEQSGF